MVATALTNLGQALDAQRKYGEAETTLREALDLRRSALGPDHPCVAITLVFLSTNLMHLGRFKEAEQVAQEAVTINAKDLGAEHPRTQEASGVLGMALGGQKRWSEAEPRLLAYAAALESKAGMEGDRDEVVKQILDMYTAWGKPDGAVEWRKKLTEATVKKAP